jgi:hypothetical protein
MVFNLIEITYCIIGELVFDDFLKNPLAKSGREERLRLKECAKFDGTKKGQNLHLGLLRREGDSNPRCHF